MRSPAVASTFLLLSVALIGASPARVTNAASAPGGWTAGSPREEIQPQFTFDERGGRSGKGALLITADAREGLDGQWSKTFPVEGGRYYRFNAHRRVQKVEWPQQSTPVRVVWLDEKGASVLDDRPVVEGYLKGFTATAEAEYPPEMMTTADGWTAVSAVYKAPAAARQARVELHLKWAPNGRVEWSGVELTAAAEPPSRRVRLASVHLQPRQGKTPEDKRRQFAPLIEQAAQKKADLVVLPETLTYYGTGLSPAEVAEPIPGPSTAFFGDLARKHDLYIVAGLYEKAAHLVYNVAVLLGPDGAIIGKFRKVTLPDGEAQRGVAPGREYPVFNTRFGKVGMMICYDGFFPEVARELTKRGAEVIAWPVWGAHPDLPRARAMENQVYLVSSTYEDISRNWGFTAVWDPSGRPAALAKDWGTVVVAEVDLSPTRWLSLGDFRSKLQRHVPLIPARASFE